ncbi:MAG: hypothetical protein OT477_19380 [Chloroflexi bacterium]|nr:hypothetical protein [Chloroflexota bacterium]
MRKTIVGFLLLSFWLTLTVGIAMGQPTAEPQPVTAPVLRPLAAPEAIYSPPLSITTFFSGGNSFAGNMFDVANVSPNPIVINSFDVHLGPGTGVSISVYHTPNTYVGKELDSSQWTLMGTDTVDSAGTNQPTPVEIGGLLILPGESYGFYLTVSNYPAASMQYTNGSNVISNGDLSLTLGIGKGNPDFTGTTFLSRSWNGTIYYSPSAGISVNKTVGTDPNACATGDELTLPATGGAVTYCYTVENTGGITLTNHNLVDDQLGTILNNLSYNLAPGASAYITATTLITHTVVNSATWTADDGSVTATASDIATVTVPIANPSIVFTQTVGLDPDVCANTEATTLPYGGGDVTFCFTVQNTGDITLTHHYVSENLLGVVLNNVPYDLAPNATTFVTGTVNITQTYVSGSVWQAFIAGSPVPISAYEEGFANVTVEPHMIGVELSADDAQSGAVGSVVTYTVSITNTGNASNGFLLELLSNNWATTLVTDTIILNAGASTTFEVAVTVPITAADGEMDTAVIQATAGVGRFAGGGSVDTISLTTTAVVAPPPANPVIYLPMIIKP